MRFFPLAVAAVSLVLVLACSSDPAPCNGKGTLAGSEACARLKSAFEEKCSSQGLTFDCNTYLAPTQCKPNLSFCTEGVDKGATDLRASADCLATRDVKITLVCFD